MTRKRNDPILPAHYAVGDPYEHYVVAERWRLPYCLACATKYIMRAGKKPGVSAEDDLLKAKRFIDMELMNIEHRAKKTGQGKNR